MNVLAILGILLSLLLLIYLAYKGWCVIAIAPLVSLVAVIIGAIAYGESPHLLAHYTETFMTAAGSYIKNYFPIFMLGAVFGKMLELSGAAQSIANTLTDKLGEKWALLSVIITGAILTYGGVSLFVTVFAVYPIGARLFRRVGIPKRFLPGTIALSSFTFTMTALPGSPQIQNAIPMRFFGTDAFAAPVLGIIAAVVEFGLGYMWLSTRAKKAMARNEGYGDHKEAFKEISNIEGGLPSFTMSILPIVIVIVFNLLLSKVYFPNTNGDYLESFGTTLSGVIGTWSLMLALLVGIIFVVLTNRKRLGGIIQPVYEGSTGSFLPIFNTASENGYGATISSLAAYAIISGAIVHISSNVLISTAVATCVLSGITGSASGGLTIALSTMGDQLIDMANQAGISMEAMHRIAAVASGGMDTFPHNGAVITLLAITGMKHKESYADIGMCTVVIPLIATIVIIICAAAGLQC